VDELSILRIVSGAGSASSPSAFGGSKPLQATTNKTMQERNASVLELRPAGQPLLAMRDVSKSFPGVQALSHVDLEVRRGEIHAIVGENGAGKSTLMKILAGVHRPTAGRILWEGNETEIASPQAAQRLGIRMVFQELSLVPDLSVAENIMLGRMPRRGPFLDRRALIEEARRALATIGSRMNPERLVAALTISQRQLVEIARVVSSGARLVVLDEPTSSLSDHEAQILLNIIRSLKERGIAVIYISHRLHEVQAIAERVTVMRDGRTIETRAVAGTTPGQLVEMMVGRALDDVFPKTVVPIGDICFRADRLSSKAFRDVSLSVRHGEIVGLAGLVGAGRTEFARAVFGLDPFDSGALAIDGKPVHPRNPVQAIRAGIGYLPEDRRLLGIVPPLTIRENLSLSILSRLAVAGFVSGAEERRTAGAATVRLGVVPPDMEVPIETLSGGNQQKVVLGRWLGIQPRLLILDEPTRGVDVGAKAEIHRIIGELAGSGIAILLISSELPEVIAASDRIYVLHEGRVTGEFDRQAASEQAIMLAATGSAGARQ
jgi:ABC-type sugar transport system ATPase subunit